MWGYCLTHFRSKSDKAPSASFGDLTLCDKEGEILEEDAEFYKLKSKLFAVCVDIITMPSGN
jgi:hypothetical protein